MLLTKERGMRDPRGVLDNGPFCEAAVNPQVTHPGVCVSPRQQSGRSEVFTSEVVDETSRKKLRSQGRGIPLMYVIHSSSRRPKLTNTT